VNAVTSAVPPLDPSGRVTFSRVLLSEWTKFRSVRSTAWSLGIAIVLTIGIPLLAALATKSHHHAGDHSAPNAALDIALVGVQIAQLVIAVLGVLVVTPEYSTGSIRSTFTAVPKRLPVLWAKLIDYALVSLALLVPAVLVSFFATQAILGGIPEFHLSFSSPGVARCVLLAPVYVALVGTFAVALGAIVRSTAGGITLFAGIFFVLPPLMLALPQSWQDAISPYLPSDAGEQMLAATRDPQMLTPLAGGLVFVGYCAILIAIAAVLLRRRDV
jgi:ABC-type transport system involved in multi-copper enzyme maturation permease subunit